MERGPESDSEPEWTAPGPETGLEEQVGQLGLGVESESYPERPDQADCIYYLRTGYCGYGSRCRFNHPPDRAMIMEAERCGIGEYPERAGQPICQYYMRTGTCRFGSSCKYHHPKEGGDYAIHVPLNNYGYPLRPGENECSYYVKTGRCKFGATCKFHHPAPAVQVPAPSPAHQVPPVPTLYSTVQSPSGGPSSQQYGVVMARPPLLPGSYVQGPYGPLLLSPGGMVSFPSWNSYPGPISSSTQPVVGSNSIFRGAPLSPSAPAYTGSYEPVPYSVGPSSSNQNEQSFIPEVNALKANVILSPLGLPLRPGAPTCTHFSQHGVCKFGPACRFDHPMEKPSHSPSATSLSDMPVVLNSVESANTTLALSSSPPDLQPELLSGSSKAVAEPP